MGTEDRRGLRRPRHVARRTRTAARLHRGAEDLCRTSPDGALRRATHLRRRLEAREEPGARGAEAPVALVGGYDRRHALTENAHERRDATLDGRVPDAACVV